MACKIQYVRPIYFVRWMEPQLADLAAVQTQLEAAHKSNGGPVIYIAIVPADSAAPDDRTRGALINTMQGVLAHCESMRFVIEGQGFKHAFLRSALAGILLVRGQRGKVFVHTTLEAALSQANELAAKGSKFSVSVMLRKALEAEIATPSKPPVELRR